MRCFSVTLAVMNEIIIPFTGDAPPVYAHHDDAGADLRAAADVLLLPGERALIPTGVAVALPEGYAGFVLPRSGLALRNGVTILNAPGLIDAGYRGELKVTLINTDKTEAFQVRVGVRIAQLVVMPVTRAVFTPVAVLPESVRGSSGFGSTGSG